MSPAKVGLPDDKGPQEYIFEGQDVFLDARDATISTSGRVIDIEGLLSRKDGFQLYYFEGCPVGRVNFPAGNVPEKERPFVTLQDGRVITPIREDEMPDYRGGKLERK